MSEPIAYCNGAYVPYAHAQLPLHDAGVVWGALITDRVRTFRQQPFRLDEHIQRFIHSCQQAQVPLERSALQLTVIAHEVLLRNKRHDDDQEFSLLFIATPGPLPTFAPVDVVCQPSLLVYALPLDPERFRHLQTHGAVLQTSVATLGCAPSIKHRSRLPWWIEQQNARRDHPQAEALFITHTGDLLETPTANILAVIDGVLVTPPRQQFAIPFDERPLNISELVHCTEALLTNTTYCVARVARIDALTLPPASPLFDRLLQAWSALVGVALGP
jgi:branched-chain amino acid aminotransferase